EPITYGGVSMSTTFFFSTDHTIFEISKTEHGWTIKKKTSDHTFYCLAIDQTIGRLYGGTFDNGLWFSDDQGETWQQVGSGITSKRVLSVAVSQIENNNDYNTVWAGTEPSALFRSEDGGQTWEACPSLLD